MSNFITSTEAEKFVADLLVADGESPAEFDVAKIVAETYAYSAAYCRWVITVGESEFWQIVERCAYIPRPS